MRLRIVGIAAMALMVLGGGTAAAQSGNTEPGVGKQAGSVMLRGRVVGVIPMDSATSTSIGGHVTTTNTPAPEVDLSYFITDNIALELIAASTEHSMKAVGTRVGTVDVGSTWVLPPTLTLQYHFMPRERFSPYVGAGVNASFFYATSGKGPTVQSLSLDDNVGAAIQAGFDYNVAGRWFFNFDVKQIFVNTTAHLGTPLGAVTAKTSLDPLVIGAGIGYRF